MCLVIYGMIRGMNFRRLALLWMAASSAIISTASTLSWTGPTSGGDWNSSANWSSSDGKYVFTAENDYDFSSLANGAVIVNNITSTVRIRSLVLPSTHNATWTFTGSANLRLTTKLMPLNVPSGSTLNLELGASNPWSNLAENSYALSGGGTVRHTKLWEQWTYPNINIEEGTIIIAGAAKGTAQTGFSYTHFNLLSDKATLRLETDAVIANMACPSGVSATLDLNGYALRRTIKDLSTADWNGRTIGGGTFTVEGGIPIAITRAPESPVTYDIRNACLNLGSATAPLTTPSGSGIAVESGGAMNLYASQTLSHLSSTSPIGCVNIASSCTLSVNTSERIAYGARLTGGGSLIKSGSGTLTLSGCNSYSGSTRVSGGVLKLARKTTKFDNLWTFDTTATNDVAGAVHLGRKSEYGKYRFPMPVRMENGRTGGCLHFPHRDSDPDTHYRIMTSDSTVACGTNSFTIGAWIRPVFTNISTSVLFCGPYPDADSSRRLLQVTVSSRHLSHSAVSWAQQRISLPRGRLDDGKWHHICIAQSADERKTYVDGELVDAVAGNFNLDRGKLSIGGMDLWGNDFEGDMDDIFIISRKLSDAEVRKFVVEGIVNTDDDITPNSPRPVAHWSFDSDFTDDVGGIKLVSGVGRVTGSTGTPVIESAPGVRGKCVSFAAGNSCLTLADNEPFPSAMPTGRAPFSVSLRAQLKRHDGMLALFSIGDLTQANRGFWAGGYSYPAHNACGCVSTGWDYFYRFTDSTMDGAVNASGLSEYGWTHFVVTYDGYRLRHYRDGCLLATKYNDGLDIRPQDLFLGYLKANNYYSKGAIDDLGIYDRMLTQDEVIALTEELAIGDDATRSTLPIGTAITIEAGGALSVSGSGHTAGSLNGSGRLFLESGSSLSITGEVNFAGSLTGGGTLSADSLSISGDASSFHGSLILSRCEKPPKDLSGITLPTPPAGESWKFSWTNGTLRLYSAAPERPKDPTTLKNDTAYIWSTKGGGISSSGLEDLSLSPKLVKKNWITSSGSCDYYGTEADGSRRFTLATDEGTPMDGTLVLTQKDENTVRAVWTFTPGCDTGYYQLEVMALLSVPAFEGGQVAFGSSVYSLPLSENTNLKVPSATFKNAEGETVFALTFPDSNRNVELSKRTSWNVEEMSLMVYRTTSWPLGTLTKGTDYVLTIDISASRPVKVINDPTTVITVGSDWIPLDPVRFPKHGSALDFTNQRGTSGPAGAKGRIICAGDHFAFENDPSGHPRFYGNNIDIGKECPTGETAAQFARDMAAFGYNTMRVWLRDGIAWKDTGDPALVTLNDEGMDKVDWLLAKFFENGIYVTLDLSCERTNTWRSVGVDRDGNLSAKSVLYLSGIHDGVRSNYLAWVKNFFLHRNPYTGRTYAEEPALLGFNLLNESNNQISTAPTSYPSDCRDVAQQAWIAYAARKKKEDPTTYASLTDALPSSMTELPNGPAYMQMIAEGERRLAAEARRIFREEIGSPIPLANLNGGSYNLPLLAANEAYDYDDDHRYVDHPSFIEESWRLPARAGNGNRNFVRSTELGKQYCRRLIDRPYSISEDNLCAPWCNAAASGFAIGAVSALQGGSTVYRFCWADSRSLYTTPEANVPNSSFSTTANPLLAASERLGMALFSRQDLPTLEKRYVYAIDPDEASRPIADNADSPTSYFPLGWSAWRTRLGFVISNEVPSGVISAGKWPTVMRKTRDEACADLGISAPAGTEVLADGSTVEVNQLKGSLFVSTSRTAAGYAESGTISAGPLSANIGNLPAAVWACAIDGRPLVRSNRILFGHLTEEQAEGRRFAEPDKKVLLSWGSYSLMRNGRAETSLALGKGIFKVYALAMDGTRRFEVPCSTSEGVLHFTADVAAEPTRATCFYEIVRFQNGLMFTVK